jgi:integrase
MYLARRQKYQYGSLRIRKRKKGADVWELRYYANGEDGQRVCQSVIIGSFAQYPTETLARKKCEGKLLSLNKDCAQNVISDPTFGALIDRFIDEERLEEILKAKSASERAKFGTEALEYSTVSGYLSYIKNQLRPKWGEYHLTEIRPMLIQDWLRKLDYAPKTKGGIKALMHRLFEKAMLWELLPVQRNPVELVEVKGITRRTKKPIVLTLHQYEKVLENIPSDPYKTMVVVAICLGLRVSEILALKWDDVDFKQLTMRVSRKVVNGRVSRVKTEYSEDDLPLSPAFAERLLRWQKECPMSGESWMFPNPFSLNPFWASEVQKDYLIPAGSKAGVLNLGWHSFRHTYRSFLDATGAPIGVQQKLMRHAQVSTTMNIYGNAQMDSKREAHGKVVQMVLKEAV